MFTVFRAVLVERLPVRDPERVVVLSTYKDPTVESGLMMRRPQTDRAADANDARHRRIRALGRDAGRPDGRRSLRAAQPRSGDRQLLRRPRRAAGARPALSRRRRRARRAARARVELRDVARRIRRRSDDHRPSPARAVRADALHDRRRRAARPRFPIGRGVLDSAVAAQRRLVDHRRRAPRARRNACRARATNCSPSRISCRPSSISSAPSPSASHRRSSATCGPCCRAARGRRPAAAHRVRERRQSPPASRRHRDRASSPCAAHSARRTATSCDNCCSRARCSRVGGGALGLVSAAALLRILVAFAPPQLPRVGRHSGIGHADRRGVRRSPLITLLVFGVGPALIAARGNVATTLRLDSRSGGDSAMRRRVRYVLVASQTALALVMLSGGLLLARSLARLEGLDLGYQADHLSILGASWPAPKLGARSQALSARRTIGEAVARRYPASSRSRRFSFRRSLARTSFSADSTSKASRMPTARRIRSCPSRRETRTTSRRSAFRSCAAAAFRTAIERMLNRSRS